MTEAEWLACDDVPKMLRFLHGRSSDRKARLFGCAECRARVHLFFHSSSLESLEVLERYIEGEATPEDLADAHWSAETPLLCFDQEINHSNRFIERGWLPEWVARLVELGVLSPETYELLATPDATDRRRCVLDAARLVDNCTYAAAGVTLKAFVSEYPPLEDNEWSGGWLVRDIFGNPFRPVTFSPEWRTDTAVSLARQMYEAREFSAMPILADALQDAGCDNDDVLSHCRDAGATHVRGCWVVDLVLGKE
jgi:hypothetical protein